MSDLQLDEDTLRRASAIFASLAEEVAVTIPASLDRSGDRGVYDAGERFDHWYRGVAALLCSGTAMAGQQIDQVRATAETTEAELSKGLG